MVGVAGNQAHPSGHDDTILYWQGSGLVCKGHKQMDWKVLGRVKGEGSCDVRANRSSDCLISDREDY